MRLRVHFTQEAQHHANHSRRRNGATAPSSRSSAQEYQGHLGRDVLLGTEGNAVSLVLAAAGYNVRLLRSWLA
jgi:hypothetical protein